MTGADKTSALMQTVMVGLTNLTLTLVAMVLINRVGRKALLLRRLGDVRAFPLVGRVGVPDARQGWVVMLA